MGAVCGDRQSIVGSRQVAACHHGTKICTNGPFFAASTIRALNDLSPHAVDLWIERTNGSPALLAFYRRAINCSNACCANQLRQAQCGGSLRVPCAGWCSAIDADWESTVLFARRRRSTFSLSWTVGSHPSRLASAPESGQCGVQLDTIGEDFERQSGNGRNSQSLQRDTR